MSSKAKKTKEPNKEKKMDIKDWIIKFLENPEPYIGSMESTIEENTLLFDLHQNKMICRDVTYVPGLLRIYEEVLLGAASQKKLDKKESHIEVTINQKQNEISVHLFGRGIPIVNRPVEKVFEPTYRYSYLKPSECETGQIPGVKLCNLLSKTFKVETSCKENGHKFTQTWSLNMREAGGRLLDDEEAADFTKVTFYPDLARFKMSKLDQDTVDVMVTRAAQVAITTGLIVLINGKELGVKSFQDFVKKFRNFERESGNPCFGHWDRVDKNWEIGYCVGAYPSGFRHASFVNNIATSKGGTHVAHVADVLLKGVVEKFQAELKKKKVDKSTISKICPEQIKSQMWLFLNCKFSGQEFRSPTRNFLTQSVQNFDSKFTPSQDLVNSVYNLHLLYYQEKKKQLTSELQAEISLLENQVAYLESITSADGEINISLKTKDELINELQLHFDSDPVAKFKKEKEVGEAADEAGDRDFNYLLNMDVCTLATTEGREQLGKKLSGMDIEKQITLAKDVLEFWIEENSSFVKDSGTSEEGSSSSSPHSASTGDNSDSSVAAANETFFN